MNYYHAHHTCTLREAFALIGVTNVDNPSDIDLDETLTLNRQSRVLTNELGRFFAICGGPILASFTALGKSIGCKGKPYYWARMGGYALVLKTSGIDTTLTLVQTA